MKQIRFSSASFLVGYCCAYVGVLAADMPMFRYYPLHGDFSWGSQVLKGIGPAMAWYGLMASAAAIAFVFSLIMPQSTMERACRNFLWVFPLAAMVCTTFLMRRFFL